MCEECCGYAKSLSLVRSYYALLKTATAAYPASGHAWSPIVALVDPVPLLPCASAAPCGDEDDDNGRGHDHEHGSDDQDHPGHDRGQGHRHGTDDDAAPAVECVGGFVLTDLLTHWEQPVGGSTATSCKFAEFELFEGDDHRTTLYWSHPWPHGAHHAATGMDGNLNLRAGIPFEAGKALKIRGRVEAARKHEIHVTACGYLWSLARES